MGKVRIIKVSACIYGSEKLQEDADWCIAHSSRRIPGKYFCQKIWDDVQEELKKEKAPASP